MGNVIRRLNITVTVFNFVTLFTESLIYLFVNVKVINMEIFMSLRFKSNTCVHRQHQKCVISFSGNNFCQEEEYETSEVRKFKICKILRTESSV